MKTIKPQRLSRGATIGIVAPASAPSPVMKIDRGIAYLEQKGYRVRPGNHLYEHHGYLAGPDSHRAEDLNGMFADPEVSAIIAVRGGYGSPRILDLIDYTLVRTHPKIFVGYSDCTALQCAFLQRAGLISFAGPMAGVEMSEGIDPFTEENFWRLLTGSSDHEVLRNPPDHTWGIIHHGAAEGMLIGGNLTMLLSLAGTAFFPSLRGALLVLEEVDEEPYRIDRMLAQLKHAGIFREISGLVLGSFEGCSSMKPDKPSLKLEEVFSDYFSPLSIPVISQFAHGHHPPMLTIPIGLKARLDTQRRQIELLEAPVV